MSLVESNAAFRQRCDEIAHGIADSLRAQGIENFSQMAFALGTPTAPPTDDALKRFASILDSLPAGVDPTLGAVANVRKLVFESQTLVLASLKAQVQGPTEGEPIKSMPFVEKTSRLQEQRRRLTGLNLEGELQPAHSLVDQAYQIAMTGNFCYICPSKSPSRISELNHGSKDKQVVRLENKSLVLGTADSELTVEIGTEIKLMWALQRRGLAFDQTRLMSWETHEAWVQCLFKNLAAAAPKGFGCISIQQLLRADKEIFSLIANEITGPIKQRPGSPSPVDALMTRFMHDPRVLVHLTPLPHTRPQQMSKPDTQPPKRKFDTAPALPQKSQKTLKVPEELQQYQSTHEGKYICWGFNLTRSCKQKVQKGRCRFGLHMCMKCRRGGHGAHECKAPWLADAQCSPMHVANLRSFRASTTDAPSKSDFHESPSVLGRNLFDVASNCEPLAIEVFAGSARLSFACKQLGFRTLAVDKDRRRHAKHHTVHFDLSLLQDVRSLCDYIDAEEPCVVHVHLAPACPTASRARERPLKALGAAAPQPLRSEAFPDGIPNLPHKDFEKVCVDNDTYRATRILLEHLVLRRISFSVANPASSWFWSCEPVASFIRKYPGHDTVFHQCMHGGTRDKKTRWYSFDPAAPTKNWFADLGILCTRDHQHTPWHAQLSLNPEEEAAYPFLLCERVASILASKAQETGFVLSHPAVQELQPASRFLWCDQPRHARHGRLVSEFQDYHAYIIPLNVSNTHLLESALASLPKGARVTHRRIVARGEVPGDAVFLENCQALPTCARVELVHVGIPRTPEDFIVQAVNKGHPRSFMLQINELSEEAVRKNMLEEPHILTTRRAEAIKTWMRRSLELREAQKLQDNKRPKHLQGLLQGKKTLLLHEMLLKLEYPDPSIALELDEGFDLTGWAPRTGVFERNVRKPDMDESQLAKMSQGLNKSIVAQLANSDFGELEQLCWDQTQAEVARGWLAVDNSQSIHECFIAKRFPLQQKTKVRLIDDFSINGINSTFGLVEKLKVDAIDVISANATRALQLSTSSMRKFLGKTFDLVDAYKQLGVSTKSALRTKIAVKVPGRREVRLYWVRALPFGAAASVVAFLRLSAALNFILQKEFAILSSVYFDDFTLLSPKETSSSADASFRSLLKLLGIQFAEGNHKDKPFDTVFNALGLQISFEDWGQGLVKLDHTLARKEEMRLLIANILNSDRLDRKQLDSLKGKVVWFGSFVFGRKLNMACKQVAKAYIPCLGKLTASLREALTTLASVLESAEGVSIHKELPMPWFIFTDGAYEPTLKQPGSVGGVLINPRGQAVSVFGEHVPDDVLLLLARESCHPIYELEILPALIALLLWHDKIYSRLVCFFTDNEAAKSALIRLDGASSISCVMLSLFGEAEVTLKIIPWIGRVPTSSNISDGPSRLYFDNPVLKNASKSKIDWETIKVLFAVGAQTKSPKPFPWTSRSPYRGTSGGNRRDAWKFPSLLIGEKRRNMNTDFI